ncbi:MAG: DEAD/DEAH box helicase [Syntrophothermus sp.]
MEQNINFSLLNEDPTAKSFIELLESQELKGNLEDSIVYYQFPFYQNEDGSLATANILLISKNHGIIVIKCCNIHERDNNEKSLKKTIADLEQIYSLIFAKLIKTKNIRSNPHSLKIPFLPLIYTTSEIKNGSSLKKEWDQLDFLYSDKDLELYLRNNSLPKTIDNSTLSEIIATLEGSRNIIRPKEREITTGPKTTKGGILDEIERNIALFDIEQKRAALFTLDGPQRIRGLAGSGKTIILTMKVALIHLQDPNAEILYTFWTKSLYSSIIKQITRFFRQFSDRDPNWNKIHVLHAWGGKNMAGVYYNICVHNNITPLPLKTNQNFKNSFNKICMDLENYPLQSIFDYSILDEAQDLPTYFYRICRRSTKNNKIIWGYDECQNILEINIQDTKHTFGKDKKGNYHIDFSNLPPDSFQDLVLHKCYRNPKKVLVVAFALGFGIYNEKIVQMLENNEHWEDMGFVVEEGKSIEGDKMKIFRPDMNSPLVKNKLLESEDLIRYEYFDGIEAETEFVGKMIKKDIANGLREEDIMVISIDDLNARIYFKMIAKELSKHKINSFNLLDAPSNNIEFNLPKHVTLSTVYRAKGNEAGSVYIVGVDSIYYSKEDITERNKLFTAITRTNAWVTITGMEKAAQLFMNEIQLAIKYYPYLEFQMPNKESIKNIQRDLTVGQAQLNKLERQLDEIAAKTGISKEKLLEKLANKSKLKK